MRCVVVVVVVAIATEATAAGAIQYKSFLFLHFVMLGVYKSSSHNSAEKMNAHTWHYNYFSNISLRRRR